VISGHFNVGDEDIPALAQAPLPRLLFRDATLHDQISPSNFQQRSQRPKTMP